MYVVVYKHVTQLLSPSSTPLAVDLLTMSSTVSPSDNDSSDESSVSSTLARSSVTPPVVAAGVTPSIPTNAHPCNVSLPPPTTMATPSFVWGEIDAFSFTHALNAAYAEAVHWRKNNFAIPYGNHGKQFVLVISRLFRAYAEVSALESIALKAVTVMSILLLQRPFQALKSKHHSSCLERRLATWQAGDINSLVMEGRSIQQRLPKSTTSAASSDNLIRSFSNFMFQGKIKAAMDLISKEEQEVYSTLTMSLMVQIKQFWMY